MNLAFSQKINGTKTYFPEKILASLELSEDEQKAANDKLINRKDLCASVYLNCHPKIHTIRVDEKDRWKKGNLIHFIINNRTKNRFQFAPLRKVISVQKITISVRHLQMSITNENYPLVIIDGNQLNYFEVQRLAFNDGFLSIQDFCDYFKEDFNGKIIHWTNFRY